MTLHAPANPLHPAYWRRWDAATCKIRLRTAKPEHLPAIREAYRLEMATRRPRKRMVAALASHLETHR